MVEYRNFWNTTTVVPNAIWVSHLPAKVNILILGAGGAGLSTAYALAQRNQKDIVVLDEHLPSWRSARKQSGFVGITPILPHKLKSAGFTDEQILNIVQLGLWNVAEVENFIVKFGDGQNWCEKESMGSFRVAFNSGDTDTLSESFKYLEHLPTKPFLFGDNTTKQLLNISNRGHASLYIPNDFVVNPARYLNGLTTACRYLGVNIYSGFHISKIINDGNELVVQDNYGNTIITKKLVICLGAFIGELANFEDINDLFIRKNIQYAITSPSSALPPYSILSHDGIETYRTYNHRMLFAFDAENLELADYKVNSMIKNVMSGKLSYKFNLHDIDMMWSRNVLVAKDHLPIICGFKTLPNIYVNLGYYEHSLSYQMIGGKILAQLIENGHSTISGSDIFSIDRIKNRA
jgi:glycine/D-amino acid oxidase-like deaminating enzyme